MPLANVTTSRMTDGNRRSIVCLAALAAAADVLLSSDDEGAQVDRAGSYPRVRTTFVNATKYLSEVEFTRAFRMSPDCFGKLLSVLRVRLERDEMQGYRSSGGVVEPAVRLGMTLRILAGASYLDMMLTFRVAKSTVFAIFWDTFQAIDDCISLPALPFANADELRRMAIDFTNSRSPPSPLHGYIGALDGILSKVSKPADIYHPAKFYCRKGYYALPFQVVVDSRYKVRYMSVRCAGATHDNLAFSVSTLNGRLLTGDLEEGFWIAADEAYTCSESILTPWPGTELGDEAKSAFNFFQSSFRMHAEQVFGQINSRFGILWRPLNFGLAKVPKIVQATFLLHNFCIDERDAPVPVDAIQQSKIAADFHEWWIECSAHNTIQGTRRDLEVSRTRSNLTRLLRNLGASRPVV
jgi:DDE superfamily endonuclease